MNMAAQKTGSTVPSDMGHNGIVNDPDNTYKDEFYEQSLR